MFESKGIVFQKLQREDLAKLLELKQESFLTTHNVTIATMEDQERWFDSLDNHVHTPRSLCLIGVRNSVKVGLIKITNIDWISRTADLAWDIFKESRGNGYGKRIVKAGVDYSFQILNLRRLTAEVLSNNPASAKCAESAGFIIEGVKQQMTYKIIESENPFDPPPAEYLDSHVYGILRQDWLANF